jgi:hypothetical protein
MHNMLKQQCDCQGVLVHRREQGTKFFPIPAALSFSSARKSIIIPRLNVKSVSKPSWEYSYFCYCLSMKSQPLAVLTHNVHDRLGSETRHPRCNSLDVKELIK